MSPPQLLALPPAPAGGGGAALPLVTPLVGAPHPHALPPSGCRRYAWSPLELELGTVNESSAAPAADLSVSVSPPLFRKPSPERSATTAKLPAATVALGSFTVLLDASTSAIDAVSTQELPVFSQYSSAHSPLAPSGLGTISLMTSAA